MQAAGVALSPDQAPLGRHRKRGSKTLARPRRTRYHRAVSTILDP
jgi:hypothetical protein